MDNGVSSHELYMLGNLPMFNMLEHVSLTFLGIHIEISSPDYSGMDRDRSICFGMNVTSLVMALELTATI